MKKSKFQMLVVACFMAASALISVQSNAQNRKLPDGTIVYNDGTKKLPNGTIIYKDGTSKNNKSKKIVLPDGREVYSNGSGRYNKRRSRHHGNGQWLPPGQAKKIYGGSARDYAHGQQKNWKKNRKWKDDDNDDKHGNNERRDNDDHDGHEKQGKSHKH